jgi:hypothetical protein
MGFVFAIVLRACVAGGRKVCVRERQRESEGELAIRLLYSTLLYSTLLYSRRDSRSDSNSHHMA